MEPPKKAAAWLLDAYHETGTRPPDARESIFFMMLIFVALVTMLHVVMLGASHAWLWLAPGDERGLAPARNAALAGYCHSLSWAVVATLYLSPRLM